MNNNTSNIYNSTIDNFKKLSLKQKHKLLNELQDSIPKNDNDKILKLIQNGPVMSDEQYQEFIKERKRFNEWRDAK